MENGQDNGNLPTLEHLNLPALEIPNPLTLENQEPTLSQTMQPWLKSFFEQTMTEIVKPYDQRITTLKDELIETKTKLSDTKTKLSDSEKQRHEFEQQSQLKTTELDSLKQSHEVELQEALASRNELNARCGEQSVKINELEQKDAIREKEKAQLKEDLTELKDTLRQEVAKKDEANEFIMSQHDAWESYATRAGLKRKDRE